MARKTSKKIAKRNIKRIKLVLYVLVIAVLIGYVVYINRDRLSFKRAPTQKTTIIVNGELISSDELEEGYRIAREQNKKLTMEEFLDNIVSLKLLLQEAAKEGVYVGDEELEIKFNEWVSSFSSEEKFDSTLGEMDIKKERLKEQMKNQLIVNKLIDKEIMANIKVSDSEVAAFYENNKESIGNLSLDDVKEKINTILVNEKRDRVLETYIRQLRAGASIMAGEEVKKTKAEINRFAQTNDEVCMEGGKPIIRLFDTASCQQCSLLKDVFDSTASEFLKDGRILAYHWELDTGDNTLTQEKEEGIPSSEVEIFRKYNSKSTVPTYIFGCKYIRVGSAYKTSYPEGEVNEIRETIRKLVT